jgi:hypothetical protein
LISVIGIGLTACGPDRLEKSAGSGLLACPAGEASMNDVKTRLRIIVIRIRIITVDTFLELDIGSYPKLDNCGELKYIKYTTKDSVRQSENGQRGIFIREFYTSRSKRYAIYQSLRV